MEQHLQNLVAGVNKWRAGGVQDYWIQVDYIGASLNRMGNHVLTFVGGKLWHQWHGEWRAIESGSDFWLYSIPGAFAWTRDMLTKVLPGSEAGADGIDLRFNDQYGYVEYLRVKAAKRNAANFTFEVKSFGVGPHSDYQG